MAFVQSSERSEATIVWSVNEELRGGEVTNDPRYSAIAERLDQVMAAASFSKLVLRHEGATILSAKLTIDDI